MSEKREDYQVTETAEQDTFSISDEVCANWLLRKLHEFDSEIALVRGQAEDIVTRLSSQREQLTRHYGAQLEQWAAQQIEGGKTKSVQLLYGTCAFRTVPSSVKIIDKDKALEFALSNWPEIVQSETVYTIDTKSYLATARAALEQSGELMPGIDHVPARENFTISFKEAK